MSIWDWIVHFSSSIEEVVLAATESAWIYVWVFLLTTVDGIFPVVPSESVVIATSAAWKSSGTPWLPLIWITAAAGAWCGDQIAYQVGTKIHLRSYRMFRSKRGQHTLDWADHALHNRGAAIIIAARFIPFGRVAVNLTAGSLSFPRRTFMIFDAIAAVIWASYAVAIGVWAAALIDNLLLSILVGVVGGVALGWLIDRILARFGVSVPDVPAEESSQEPNHG
jgi:membrane protein DedA with SNARE-associated domain